MEFITSSLNLFRKKQRKTPTKHIRISQARRKGAVYIIKVMFPKKATKIDETFTVVLTVTTYVMSKRR